MLCTKMEDVGNFQGEWPEGNTHKEKQSWPRNINVPQESAACINADDTQSPLLSLQGDKGEIQPRMVAKVIIT